MNLCQLKRDMTHICVPQTRVTTMESVQHTMQPKERIGFGDNGAPAAFASTKKEVGDEVRMGAYSELVIPSHDLELL